MYKLKSDDLPLIKTCISGHYEMFEAGERGIKAYFFPQQEDLMRFEAEGRNIRLFDIRSEASDFVIFGARACDARALDILDRVFLRDPADTYYQQRREHALIITAACTEPADTCFCSAFGIDASSPGGDISTWEHEGTVFWLPVTGKGVSLTEMLVSEGLLMPEDDGAAAGIIQIINDKLKKLPLYGLKTDAFGGGKTDEYFNSPEWSALSESCLGCGSCTFSCPTCQCYDIRDFDTGHGIIRYRCWDSCMYSEFTRMSAGQPRKSQLERFRQRFMHKLVYYPENNEEIVSCVGCGRCLKKCPVHMNIVKVIKALGGGK